MLDEPTSGLDPAGTEEVLQAIVAHVAGENMTVFFSSHQLADVDQIADHIAIIDAGRTVVAGALEDLRAQYRRVQLVFNGEAPEITFRAPGVVRMRRQGRVMTVLSNAGSDAAHRRGDALRTGLGRRAAGDLEGNLSRIGCGGGLTCSGTRPGSKPVDDFSAVSR